MASDMIRRIIVAEVSEADDGKRTLTFTGSDETMDRMDEVIRADGWVLKNYKKNPVFQWAHMYNLPPIGKSIKTWVEDKKLKFTIEFAGPEIEYPANMPSAETVYQLYKGGFLRAVSVGFIALETEKGPGADEDWGKPSKKPRLYFIKQDLLELSAVPVPANPNALGDAVTAGIMTKAERGAVEEWVRQSDISRAESEAIEGAGDEAEDPPEQRAISQVGLTDELDFLLNNIKYAGLNDESQTVAWEVVRAIMRFSGDDIPVDIQEKVGAVLNKVNKEKLAKIQELAQEILDSASQPDKDEEDKDVPREEEEKWTPEDTKEVLARAVRKAQGKLD